MKAADSSIKRIDELLVCAAVACRSGEFGGVPTACARAMGKNISRPSQVTDWIARLEKLVQAPASEPDSGFLTLETQMRGKGRLHVARAHLHGCASRQLLPSRPRESRMSRSWA